MTEGTIKISNDTRTNFYFKANEKPRKRTKLQ